MTQPYLGALEIAYRSHAIYCVHIQPTSLVSREIDGNNTVASEPLPNSRMSDDFSWIVCLIFGNKICPCMSNMVDLVAQMSKVCTYLDEV